MPQPIINITRKQALIFAGFLVMYEFLTYISNDMVMPVMIQVVHSLNASEVYIPTSLSLYVLGGASLQLILGPLSDRFGRRPVMLIGTVFFVLCTALIAFSQNIHHFLWIRFFEGMGLCFISVIGYAVIQEIFSEMDAVRLVAIMTNVAVIAPLLGPLLGAYLSTFMTWNMIFIIIALFALVSTWGLWKFMPETVGQVKKDGVEIQRMNLSVSSIYTNYKHLFTNREFMFGSISFGFLGIGCLAWIGLSPIILVKDAHLTVVEYAAWQVPVFGAFILANIVLIKLTYKLELEKIAAIGCGIAFIGLLILLTLPLIFGNNYLLIMPGIIIYFFGFGFSASPMYRMILFKTQVTKGTASALLSMTYMTVQGLGVEGANLVYRLHSNTYFGAYCAFTGFVFILIIFANKKLRG